LNNSYYQLKTLIFYPIYVLRTHFKQIWFPIPDGQPDLNNITDIITLYVPPGTPDHADLFPVYKNRIVTAFRHYSHKYCLLMRLNLLGHRHEVFESGDDSISAPRFPHYQTLSSFCPGARRRVYEVEDLPTRRNDLSLDVVAHVLLRLVGVIAVVSHDGA